MGKDGIVLSYGDTLIKESDLKLLEGPLWLNDRIISFYFEYLHDKQFDCSSRLVFISPEVSQFLKLGSKSEAAIFLEPLHLEDKDLIVLAINNSNEPDRPGGSHWSLLMFSSQADEFFHFDSSGGMNSDSARQVGLRTHSYLAKKRSRCMPFKIKEVPVLQQGNGYDCGIHLLSNAKNATRHFLLYGSDQGLEPVSADTVKSLREDIRHLILEIGGQMVDSSR
jgi:sentrin-specific protease 8